ALAAGFAFIALGARLGAFFSGGGLGVGARIGPVELLQRLRGGEPRLRLGLERRRSSRNFGAGLAAAAERGDVGRPTPAETLCSGRSRGGWGGSIGGA